MKTFIHNRKDRHVGNICYAALGGHFVGTCRGHIALRFLNLVVRDIHGFDTGAVATGILA